MKKELISRNKYKGDVLFLCQYFYPEYNSSAMLPWDTAVYLAKSGKTVGALCGYPKEYTLEKKVPETECVENVQIKRLHYLSLKRGKKLSRLINFLSFTTRVILHLKEIGRYKSVLVYSNPPILPIAAILAHLRYGTKVMFVSYDVYPEIASVSGKIAPNGIIAKSMSAVNRRLFTETSRIVVLSEDMKDYLLANREGVEQTLLSVIPNWAHEGICNDPTDVLLQKYGFPRDAFVVSYLGNMGICQDMQTIVDAVKQVKNEENVYFIFAGHGSKKELIEKELETYPNVRIKDYLTGSKFEEILSLSACGIVSLNAGLNGKCSPSKYYSYLQGGCAILSIMEKDSNVSREVVEQDIGYAISNGDHTALAEAILELKSDREKYKRMSKSASSLYNEKYDKPIAMNKYAQMVDSVLSLKL